MVGVSAVSKRPDPVFCHTGGPTLDPWILFLRGMGIDVEDEHPGSTLDAGKPDEQTEVGSESKKQRGGAT